jgi:hypothetical protein
VSVEAVNFRCLKQRAKQEKADEILYNEMTVWWKLEFRLQPRRFAVVNKNKKISITKRQNRNSGSIPVFGLSQKSKKLRNKPEHFGAGFRRCGARDE